MTNKKDQNTVVMSKEGYQRLLGNKDGNGLYWTTDINVELPVRVPSSGKGSLVKPTTLPNEFRRTVQNRGDAPALRVMRNKKEYVWSWNQYY